MERRDAERHRKADNTRAMIRGCKAAAAKAEAILVQTGLKDQREAPSERQAEHYVFVASNFIALGQLPVEDTQTALYGFAQILLDKTVVSARTEKKVVKRHWIREDTVEVSTTAAGQTVTNCRISLFSGDQNGQNLVLAQQMHLPKTPGVETSADYLSLNEDKLDVLLSYYDPAPIELEQIAQFNNELDHLNALAQGAATPAAKTAQ